ncbi:hypothetical protein QJS10_CPA07g00140 [Acorus calamus]|uniref:MalT-like TPR region domain-containing protein n=1 Tax=Acorus calamus TaxID=4465 RepID=A0AAV9EHD7_ACOCL|nr:hypothetical protein QJS10_CPA07g00140 [Acorus calamus]
MLLRHAFRRVSPSVRSYSTNGGDAVALQMVRYALSHARSQKSEESYGQALLVLEQGLSSLASEGSAGLLSLAMSTLLYERRDYNGALEKLERVREIAHSSLGCKVAACEALVGLNLETGQALQLSEIDDIVNPSSMGAANMVPEELQLPSIECGFNYTSGYTFNINFHDAEEMLTKALGKAEDQFGSAHPKVGIVLTCIALMYGHKARLEGSSSILIQEGLYRRAIDLLKAPPLDSEDGEVQVDRRDIVALARGGYADLLCLQQNRKAEGERMRKWADAAWRNRRLSLAQVLDIPEPSGAAVVDTRICRVL